MPDSTPVEIWKPVPGYEGYYEASNLGRVRSVDRLIKSRPPGIALRRGKLLVQFKNDPLGHLGVKLSRDGKSRTQFVHRIIMETFVGPLPEGMCVCHGPAGITDNRLSNLRYDTVTENNRDTVRDGNHHDANKTHCIHGHEFNAANTYYRKNGHRQCRVCARVIDSHRALRRAQERKRAAQKPNC